MTDPTTDLPADGELTEDVLDEVAGGFGLNSGTLSGSTHSGTNSGTNAGTL